MKNLFLAFIVGGLLISPATSFAQTTTSSQLDALLQQIQQLQTQLATLQKSAPAKGPAQTTFHCAYINRTLTIGSADTTTIKDVSSLQQFLIAKGFLTGNATGYFGQKTSDAVQKWQTTNGISLTAPGKAVVGPKTRIALQQACATESMTFPFRFRLDSLTSISKETYPILRFTLVDTQKQGELVASLQLIHVDTRKVAYTSGQTGWNLSGQNTLDFNAIDSVKGNSFGPLSPGNHFLQLVDPGTGTLLGVSEVFNIARGVMGN